MQTIETSIFNVNGDRLQGPLIIGTFEIRAPARLPGPISRNFALGSYEKFQPGFRDEKRQSEDFWREMRERKRTWRNHNFRACHSFGNSHSCITAVKVSVKENEVPTEKNSSRASIFATKASYISN